MCGRGNSQRKVEYSLLLFVVVVAPFIRSFTRSCSYRSVAHTAPLLFRCVAPMQSNQLCVVIHTWCKRKILYCATMCVNVRIFAWKFAKSFHFACTFDSRENGQQRKRERIEWKKYIHTKRMNNKSACISLLVHTHTHTPPLDNTRLRVCSSQMYCRKFFLCPIRLAQLI